MESSEVGKKKFGDVKNHIQKVHSILDQVGLDINTLKNRMRATSFSSSMSDVSKSQEDVNDSWLKRYSEEKSKCNTTSNEKTVRAYSVTSNSNRNLIDSTHIKESKISARTALESGEPSGLVRATKASVPAVKSNHASGANGTLKNENTAAVLKRKIATQAQTPISASSKNSNSSILTKRKPISKLPLPRSAPQSKLEASRSIVKNTAKQMPIESSPSALLKRNNRNRFLEARKTPNGLNVSPGKNKIATQSQSAENQKPTNFEKLKGVKTTVSAIDSKKRSTNKKLTETKPISSRNVSSKLPVCDEIFPKAATTETSHVKITEELDKKQYMLNSIDPLIVSLITEIPITKKAQDNTTFKNLLYKKQEDNRNSLQTPKSKIKSTAGSENLKSKIPRPTFVSCTKNTFTSKKCNTIASSTNIDKEINERYKGESKSFSGLNKVRSSLNTTLKSSGNTSFSNQSDESKMFALSQTNYVSKVAQQEFNTKHLQKASKDSGDELKLKSFSSDDPVYIKTYHTSNHHKQSNQASFQVFPKYTPKKSSEVNKTVPYLTDEALFHRPTSSQQPTASILEENISSKKNYVFTAVDSVASTSKIEDKPFKASDVSLFAKSSNEKSSSLPSLKEPIEKSNLLKESDKLLNFNKQQLTFETVIETNECKPCDFIKDAVKSFDPIKYEKSELYICNDNINRLKNNYSCSKQVKFNAPSKSSSCKNISNKKSAVQVDSNANVGLIGKSTHVNNTFILNESKKKDDSWKRYHISQNDEEQFDFDWSDDISSISKNKELYFDTCLTQNFTKASTVLKDEKQKIQFKETEEAKSSKKLFNEDNIIFEKAADKYNKQIFAFANKSSSIDANSLTLPKFQKYVQQKAFNSVGLNEEKSNFDSRSAFLLNACAHEDNTSSDEDNEYFDTSDQMLQMQDNKPNINVTKDPKTNILTHEKQHANIKSLINKFEVKQKKQQLDNIHGFINTFLSHVATNTSNQLASEIAVKELEFKKLKEINSNTSKKIGDETSLLLNFEADHTQKPLSNPRAVQNCFRKISFFNIYFIFSLWSALIDHDMDIGLVLMEKFVQGLRACKVAVLNRSKSKRESLPVQTCNLKILCKILLDEIVSSAVMISTPTISFCYKLLAFLTQFAIDTLYWVVVTLIAFFIMWLGVTKLLLDCDLQIDQIFQSDLVTHHRLASHLNVY